MRSKTRLIAAVASLLVCLAMVGTGFASWVILQDKTDTATGTVKAEAVKDGELQFSVSADEVDINFVGPATQEADNEWIYSDGETGSEKLSVDFTLNVTGSVGTIDIALTEAQGIKDARTAGYISDATWSLVSVTDTTDVQEASGAKIQDGKISFGKEGTTGYEFKTGVIVVRMAYKWGGAFSTKNPYEFFNGKNRTEKVGTDSDYESNLNTYYQSYESNTWEEAAKAVLGDLYTKLGTTSGVEISVKFTAHQVQTPKAA